MSEYTPPDSINIPFTFSKERGYITPTSPDVWFAFAQQYGAGSLQAAINITQPYWETTFTYPKTCPKYVVGYGSGRVQIIRARCLYGGIRDLQGLIQCISRELFPSDLSASATGVWFSSDDWLPTYCNAVPPKDLLAFMAAHPPKELSASLTGTFFKGTRELSTFVGGHLPGQLGAFVRILTSGSPKDLDAYIGSHLPENITANLVGILFKSRGNLIAFIGSHNPINLGAFVRIPTSGDPKDLSAFMDIWHEAYLSGSLRIMSYDGLVSSLIPVIPIDLPAYIRARYFDSFPASIHGYAYKDLTGQINQVYSKSLSAYLNGRLVLYGDITAFIRGIAHVHIDLLSFLQPLHYDYLSASLRATYYEGLPSYLFAVRPKDLLARIMCWHETHLPASLVITDFPGDLKASLNITGGRSSLPSLIKGVFGANVIKDISANIGAWDNKNLGSSIYSIDSVQLAAYLNVRGGTLNLAASIVPKVIRLTTLISISTLAARNLSATINYLCFETGYKFLPASIYLVYKKDLSAYVRSLRTSYPVSLPASVGYSDSFLGVDKLNIVVNISPVSYFVEDILRFTISISRGRHNLSAYIRGLHKNLDLAASLTAVDVPIYYYEKQPKNRERFINRDYNGVFKSMEIIEMSFNDVVSEYYYSSRGDTTWKKNRFERWILDLKSILPPNELLHLKRRLHKATTVYDFKKFDSVDEAIKYAILYVTEYPQETLAASLNVRGYSTDIQGIITPRYSRTAKGNLSSSITPTNFTTVVGYDDNKILKI